MKKRILVVDDNPSIHEDFKRILKSNHTTKLDSMQALLFGKNTNQPKIDILTELEMDSAFQGQEALDLVKKSTHVNNPYSLAFVDIRMPPGWDGMNTIKHLWQVDPKLQIVICTAHSDHSWQDMFIELHGSENFLILKKPFDVTEVRQMAVALTKKWEYKRRIENKLENLEAAIYERTQDLQHALELAEDANQFKNEFLGNVSHELRTPLQSIIGFTELMYYDKANKKDFKKYFNDILSSAKLLLQMIIDIIDMSSLESKSINFHPEEINIKQLLEEIKEMFTPMIEEKKLKFNYKIDPKLTRIVIDPTKLKQIIRHYVANAIKFSTEGGKIEIHVNSIGNEKFKIEVIDTGVGISKEDIKKLFNPFQQADLSMTKRYHGIGLGLALTRRIAEFQGGEVGVTSDLGKGSTFFVILPLIAP